MQLHFQKMQGTGNQILIVDQRVADPVAPDARILEKLRRATTDERFDQLMWLNNAQDGSAEARYRVFNADGSEVEQCGNGVRCVAALLAAQNGDLPAEFMLESPAGVVKAHVTSPTHAAVDMGAPSFDDKLTQLTVDGAAIDVNLVSMGNPHCVLTVDDVHTADVAGLGAAIENHAQFPDRINVGFMQPISRSEIQLRVHERGAGETLACGTGACAAVASGIRRGLLDDEVTVHLPGGQLVVSWRGAHASIWLSGDVSYISEGMIDI